MKAVAWLLAAAAEIARAQTGATISGTVTDSVSHRGLAEALVSTDGARGLTGSDGGFTLTGVKSGPVTIRVKLTGYRQGEVSSNADPAALARVDVEMHPLASIRGRVVDRESGKVLRRLIMAQSQRALGFGGISEPRDEFEIRSLEPDDYTLTVEANDSALILYEPADKPSAMTAYAREKYPATIHLAEGEQRFVEFPVQQVAAFCVSGAIEFPAGIEEAQLTLGVRGGGGASFSRDLGSRRPGSFRIEGLTPGRYRVIAEIKTAAGRFYGGAPVNVTDHNIDGARIMMLPGVDIRGQVRVAAGDGDPPKKLDLLALLLSTERDRNGPVDLKVSEDGTFHVDAIPPGDYWLEVLEHPAGYAVLKVLLGELDTGFRPISLGASANLTVVLTSRPGAMTGTVRNRDKLPVKGAVVSINPEFGNTELRRGALSGDSGEFLFHDLTPGLYKIDGGPTVEVRVGETSNVEMVIE